MRTPALMMEQGALSAEATEDTLLSAIRDLVIPGFDRLGCSTLEVRRWLESGAPTS